MNKRGYLKTLEAILAIIIILVVVYTIVPKYVEPRPEPPLVVQDSQRFIISDISNDDALREQILTGDPLVAANVQDKIRARMPANYDFICAICSKTNSCVQITPLSKAIYMSDVFVASSMGLPLAQQKPKIVRFWMWTKPTTDIASLNTCQEVS
jgi:hypothetical protein